MFKTVVTVILLVVAAGAVTVFSTSAPPLDTPRQRLEACEQNLREIATALDLYAAANGGRYPPRLSALVPRYLKQIPTCPAAHRDTYSASYGVGDHPPRFSIACKSDAHAEARTPSPPK